MAFTAFQEKLRQLFKRAKFDGGVVIKTSPVVEVEQTWANPTGVFTAKKTNVVNKGSATSSLIEDWQVDGVSRFSIGVDGTVYMPSVAPLPAINHRFKPNGYGLDYLGDTINIPSGNFSLTGPYNGKSLRFGHMSSVTALIGLTSTADIAWTNSSTVIYGGTFDLGIARNAAGVLEINTGTAGSYASLRLKSGGSATSFALLMGNTGIYSRDGYTTNFVDGGGNNVGEMGNTGFTLSGVKRLAWAPSTTMSAAPDTGIGRNAAGVVEINNNTAGAFRDLTLRGIQFGSMLTVGTLPSAASSEGMAYRVSDALAPTVGSAIVAGGSVKAVARASSSAWIVIEVA